MKKKYITPVCTTVAVCTTQLINGSQTPPQPENEYNATNETGKIRIGTALWGASSAD